MKTRRISLSRRESLNRHKSSDNVPLYVEVLETTPLIPGTDAWARRRELNRRAKFIGVAISLGFLLLMALLVAAITYLLFFFDGDDAKDPDKNSVVGLGNGVARLNRTLGRFSGKWRSENRDHQQ